MAPQISKKYSRYVSPVSRVEAEMQAAVRQKLYRKLPTTSGSADSLSITATILTEQANDSEKNALYDIDSILPERISLEDPQSSKLVTLTQVIQQAQQSLLFDPHLLPAKIFLGILYKEKGELSQSQNYLEGACTQNRHRGASSGRTGFGSVYGGPTSIWGWTGWYTLAKVFMEQGMVKEAQKFALYALDIQNQCPVRGFECLTRF
jgi:tetratricopeptide (TPR) repeat protein